MKEKVYDKLLKDAQLRKFISLVYPQFFSLISDYRITEMTRMYCNGETFQSIGIKFGLSQERVRQLVNRGVRRVISIFMRQQLLYEKIDTLGSIIQAKDEEIKTLTHILNTHREEKNHNKPKKLHRKEEIYQEINTRLKSVLRSLDIIFLEDLCQYSKADFMGYRNFGKKSFLELKSVLNKYNIKLKD